MDLRELSGVQPAPRAETSTPLSQAIALPSAQPQSIVNFDTVRTSETRSIGERLDAAPSVNLRKTSASLVDPRVRGFNSSQIGAMVSGAAQIKTRIDIDSHFSQIDPDFIQQVQVFDGPYTAINGPGFAFLIADLRAPQRFESLTGNGRSSFQFNSNGGELGIRQEFGAGQSDWGVLANFGLEVGNDYYAWGAANDFPVPASYRQSDAYFAVDRDFGLHWRGELRYIRRDMFNVELPGVIYDINRGLSNQFLAKFAYRDQPGDPDAVSVLFWTGRTTYGSDSSRDAKRRTFFNTYLAEIFPVLDGGIVVGHGSSSSTGVRLMAQLGNLEEDNRQARFGADWQLVAQRYLELNFNATGAPAFGENDFGIPQSSYANVGIFADSAWRPFEDVRFNVGGRIDYHSSSLDATDPITASNPLDPEGRYLAGFNQPRLWLPMVFATIAIEPFEGLEATFSAAAARRPPRLSELYSDQPWVPLMRFGNSIVDGNSDLDSERITQLDFGATKKWDDIQIGTKLFASSISKYILPVSSTFSTFAPSGQPAPPNVGRDYSLFVEGPVNPNFNYDAGNAQLAYRYVNIDRATLAGGEVFGSALLLEGLALTTSAAYVKGVNHSPVRFIESTRTFEPVEKGAEALPGIYPLTGTVGLRWFDARRNRWSLELTARLVHSQDFVADGLGEVRTPGFATYSLAGAFKVRQGVAVRMALLNLFDRTYFEHGSLALTDRNGLVSFVKEPGLSLLTSVECVY